jgi:hypothetical protein
MTPTASTIAEPTNSMTSEAMRVIKVLLKMISNRDNTIEELQAKNKEKEINISTLNIRNEELRASLESVEMQRRS